MWLYTDWLSVYWFCWIVLGLKDTLLETGERHLGGVYMTISSNVPRVLDTSVPFKYSLKFALSS